MLNAIIRASLKGRGIVLALALLVGSYGLYTATLMPIDVLPDLNRPIVTIMTEAHGMIPEDVETLVTWPIEQVMSGATGVHRVRSASGPGLSVVWIEFDWDTDILVDRQVVAEKLQLAKAEIPADLSPTMAPISSIMGQIQLVGFSIPDDSIHPDELRLIIDRDIKPRIRSITGVAQVVTIGGQPTELQVIVDADKLRHSGLSLAEIETAVQNANVNATGSYLEVDSRGPLVAVPGLIHEAPDLELALVKEVGHRKFRIGDVAEVVFGPTAVPTGDAGIDGSTGVIMVISKQPNVDTVELTKRIDAELNEIAGSLPPGVEVINDLFRQADFIDRAIDNVFDAVRDGGILVVVILFLFLLNVRTTLITLTAIPLSVACAAIIFRAFGLSIDTMTLGGLAVAIGTLVDDAIVDVENVFRRLHENAKLAEPLPTLEVIFKASSEIRKPVMYGTLLVSVVYLPLFFLSGIEGRLFAPIGLAYIVSVMSSLFIALTVTPVLCYYLLGMRTAREREYGGFLIRFIHRASNFGGSMAMRHTPLLLAAVGGLILLATVTFFSMGRSFLPEFNEGSFQVNLILDPDSSLTTSADFGRRLEKSLMTIEGVAHVGRRTGRAAGDEHAMPSSINEAIVTIDPESERSRDEVLADIRDRIAEDFPGVISSTEQPLKHLLDHLLSGVTASVAIKISGPDLDILRESAAKAQNLIADIEGVRDLYVEPQTLIDQVEIAPNRPVIAAHGLSVANIAETVNLAMGAEEVSRMQVGRMSIPITVRLRNEDRNDLEKIRQIRVQSDVTGHQVALQDVAAVAITKTPNNINRENTERRIVVQLNVEGRPLSELVADVNLALEPLRDELSQKGGAYAVNISGQFEAEEEASRVISILSLISLVAMFLILYMHFRSTGLALLVLLSRPIAFIGAVTLIIVTDQVVSIATLVGFIALLGVSTRNAILLVDHYLHLMREEACAFSPETILRAGRERAIPILMTALTSGIGLLPLALAPGQPGRELLYPVATVMIGGLFSSTALDFLVTPALFWRLGRNEAERLVRDSETSDYSS